MAEITKKGKLQFETLENPSNDANSSRVTDLLATDLGGFNNNINRTNEDILTGDVTLSQLAATRAAIVEGEGKQQGLQDVLDRRDRTAVEEAFREANLSGTDEDQVEAGQNFLRLTELQKATAGQRESEQLAQRSIIREQQANQQSHVQAQEQAQAARAGLSNISGQSGFSSSSVFEGMSSSLNSQVSKSLRGFTQAERDLSNDSSRLTANLSNNLEFLNTTFDLGGEVGAANQSLLQQQANDQARAQDRGNLIGGITAGASIGGSIGGPVGAGIGAGIGLLTAVFGG